MRVKVNGTVLNDLNGVSWHGSETLTTLEYDLSAYAGNNAVYITFESACKYNTNYSSGNAADFVWIDNVCSYELTACTNYGLTASVDSDVLCNGGVDGIVSSNTIMPDTFFSYSNSYLWSDSSNTVVGYTSSISGLPAGTYTCTSNDAINGCTASSSVTITEPSPLSISTIVVPSSTPSSNNGSVDITISGGTPPYSYLWSNGVTTEDVFNLGMGPIDVMVTDGNGCFINNNSFITAATFPGCTDSTATNYDPSANTDDGSCYYAGCMDSLAVNYNSNANVSDSSCCYIWLYRSFSI